MVGDVIKWNGVHFWMGGFGFEINSQGQALCCPRTGPDGGAQPRGLSCPRGALVCRSCWSLQVRELLLILLLYCGLTTLLVLLLQAGVDHPAAVDRPHES